MDVTLEGHLVCLDRNLTSQILYILTSLFSFSTYVVRVWGKGGLFPDYFR